MSKRKKVAVFATEPVTERIGGLGIRQLEIARTLAKHFDVRLLTEYRVGSHKQRFKIEQIDYERSHSLEEPIRWADVVYGHQPQIGPLVKKFKKPCAVDLLVHEYFEDLERLPLGELDSLEQSVYFSECITRVARQLDMGDFFLCANERERDYYLGILTVLGKLRPDTYLRDRNFDSLIGVVPFGIPRREPKKGKNIFRGKVQGIGPKDFLIVWGGTLANWFDCLTPARAMARLKKRCPSAKLIFTASKHPVTAEVPEAHQKVIDLAREKGILDKSVFFSPGWIPYDQHEYYLTEADAGIVTFHDHIENRFSFRIRMVNYLWGNLPILSNPGNVMSDLIAEKNLGRIFAFGDDKELADQIEWMVTHPSALKKIRRNISAEKKKFHWDKVLAPLVQFCQNPQQSRTLFSNGRLCERETLEKRPGFSPDRLARLVPSHPYLRLNMAKNYFSEGRIEEASELIQEHMRLFGDGLDTELFRLPIFEMNCDFSFEDLLKLVPHHPHARLMQAKIKMNQNQLDEAGRLIKEEARLYGGGAEITFFKGLLHQRLGDHGAAVKHFEQVFKELPKRIECRLPLAESLNHLGQKGRARRLYALVWKKGVNEQDHWMRERVALGMSQLESTSQGEVETLDCYLEQDPQNPRLLYAKASALEKAGNNREAGALFQKLASSSASEQIRGAAWFRLARLSPKDRQKRMLKECLKFDSAHGGAKKLLRSLSENKKPDKICRPASGIEGDRP